MSNTPNDEQRPLERPVGHQTYNEDFDGTMRPRCFCGYQTEEENYDHDYDIYICSACNGVIRDAQRPS